MPVSQLGPALWAKGGSMSVFLDLAFRGSVSFASLNDSSFCLSSGFGLAKSLAVLSLGGSFGPFQ